MLGNISLENIAAVYVKDMGGNFEVGDVEMVSTALVVLAVVMFLVWRSCVKTRVVMGWPWLSSSCTWQLRKLHFLHSWTGIAFFPLSLCSAPHRMLSMNEKRKRNSPETTPNTDPPSKDPPPLGPTRPDPRDGVQLGDCDLRELISYINDNDSWQFIMERSTPTLTYQAWYKDRPFGPTIFRTRTVFENVSPELIRDFYWDDELRIKWDKMLVHFRTLHVCPQTGAMIVHWARKLPVIFSEREYIIVRRIWSSGSHYYCVTKGTTHPSLPKRKSPRRVEVYYSSYRIKPVESRNNEQPAATEVLFFHYEDIGIPKEIVKMGVRAAMWSLVRRMDAAVQSYNLSRANTMSLSSYVLWARKTTEVYPSALGILRSPEDDAPDGSPQQKRQKKGNPLKWLVVGGVLIASALTIRATGRGVNLLVIRRLQLLPFCNKFQQGRRKEKK